MDTSMLIWAGFIIAGILLYFQRKKDNEEADWQFDQQRKQNLKELYESIEERTNFEKINADLFWKLIDETRQKSGGNYQNQLGLLKDKLMHYDSADLIRFDNFYYSLLEKSCTWDLYGASTILFKDSGHHSLETLCSWIICRGEIIFNNAIVNPNIILNQEIIALTDRVIADVLAELYFLKENKIMPTRKEERLEFKGNEWKQKELPSRYPELWERFA